MGFTRPLRIVLAVCALVVGASGEILLEDPPGQYRTPPGLERDVLEREVRRRIASDDPLTAAWGGRMAADLGLSEAALDVLDRLVACDPHDEDPRVFPLRATLLETLIRLDPPVNPWRLLPQAVGLLQDGVALFLLRHPARYREACLALFRHEWVGDGAWLALGNVLTSSNAPGLARRVLQGLTLQMRVRVWTGRPPRFRGPSGGVPGDGYVNWPPGFPPIVTYELDDWRWRTGTLFADGPRPVYLYRHVWEDGGLGFGSSGPFLDRDLARLEWLGRMVALPRALAAHTEVDLAWGGVAPFLREVDRRRALLVEEWRDAVVRLTRHGWLTRAEAKTLRPSVAVTVQDKRTWTVPTLPAVPPLPPGPEAP